MLRKSARHDISLTIRKSLRIMAGTKMRDLRGQGRRIWPTMTVIACWTR
jgi:hypothetical protein